MAKFNEPEKAFPHTGQKIPIGQAFCHLYSVDESIAGHEILVASSNNKAVENISRELPAKDAIAEDSTLTYFKTISDESISSDQDIPTWGLIAAVLGNAKNRSEFQKAIWGNDDTSLKHYLRAALGQEVPPIEEKDPNTGKTIERTPEILLRENIPSGPKEAAENWRNARNEFLECNQKSQSLLNQIEDARLLHIKLVPKRTELINLTDEFERLSLEENKIVVRHELAARKISAATQERVKCQSLVHTSNQAQPGFFSRLFQTPRFKNWRSLHDEFFASFQDSVRLENEMEKEVKKIEEDHKQISSRVNDAKRMVLSNEKGITAIEAELDEIAKLIGSNFADERFWSQSHGDLQKDTPWLSKAVQDLRDDTFEAAVRLHKAFIDAAAKPFRHNLMALFSTFRGNGLGTPEKDSLLSNLWATLFLVIPVLSTTFASIERMAGKLPTEFFGWLLVDEAGQAVPQAAVGAIMRSRRALIVGDPLQIPPIVALSPELVNGIFLRFGADPNIWAPPQASAQTLADTASRYGTDIERDAGSIWIGAPLLVHRRCMDPMFSISNRIAYNNLMVHAANPTSSKVVEVLGPSSWIDIQGSTSDKWCADEGRAVLGLLSRLDEQGVADPDIYIISPFRAVMQGMRNMVRSSGHFLNRWADGNSEKWLFDRIGTVHTFQGKEADTVILLLGAPNEDHVRARDWAGGDPNLLNVAATRAKSALYVVGARQRWRTHGHFQTLDRWME